MEKYINPIVLFITGYFLLNLSPTLEPLFLLKMLFSNSFFFEIELYTLHILNIVGLILVVYSTIILIYRTAKK
ncbi:hypothetical protein D1872_227900 [compost metagenome]